MLNNNLSKGTLSEDLKYCKISLKVIALSMERIFEIILIRARTAV